MDYNTIPELEEIITSTAVSTSTSPAEVKTILTALLGFGFMVWFIFIVLAVLVLIAKWKVFSKANVGGWEALIPIHSSIVELQLGGIKTYWYFLNLIAICGIGPIIYMFWKNIALAKSFGKGAGFGILLTLLPFIGYPILGFGKAEYIGPSENE